MTENMKLLFYPLRDKTNSLTYFLAVNLHVFSVSGALSSPGPLLAIAEHQYTVLVPVPVPVPTSQ